MSIYLVNRSELQNLEYVDPHTIVQKIKPIFTPGGFKNLIINGDFSIWQRGMSFDVNPATGLYTADRFLDWSQPKHGITSKQITKEMYDGHEFSGNVYKLKITGVDSTASDPVFGIAQRVEITNENYRYYLNKAYTVSFWIKTNKSQVETYVVANDGSENFPQLLSKVHTVKPNTWTKIKWTYTLSKDLFTSNNINLNTLNFVELFGVRLNRAQVNDYVELAYVQVEEGDVATKFEYIPYDIQLMRCMRYYEYINSNLYSDYSSSSSSNTFTYYYKVKKRAMPTVRYTAIANVDNSYVRSDSNTNLLMITASSADTKSTRVINIIDADAEL